jgi:hypothetical protein
VLIVRFPTPPLPLLVILAALFAAASLFAWHVVQILRRFDRAQWPKVDLSWLQAAAALRLTAGFLRLALLDQVF